MFDKTKINLKEADDDPFKNKICNCHWSIRERLMQIRQMGKNISSQFVYLPISNLPFANASIWEQHSLITAFSESRFLQFGDLYSDWDCLLPTWSSLVKTNLKFMNCFALNDFSNIISSCVQNFSNNLSKNESLHFGKSYLWTAQTSKKSSTIAKTKAINNSAK